MLESRVNSSGKLEIFTDDYEFAERCKLIKKSPHNYTAPDTIALRLALNLPIEDRTIDFRAFAVNPKFRDYQVTDVLEMIRMKTMLNANDMGLGKTAEAIEACRLLGIKRILVVCPKSVMPHWKNQFAEWCPERRVVITPKEVYPDTQVVVINYEKLAVVRYAEMLRGVHWDCVIADEAHRIKNRDAKRTKGLKSIPAMYKFALTGTPIMNMPDDMWSIFDWLDHKLVGDSYWRFVSMFCTTVTDIFGTMPMGLTKNENMRSVLKKLTDYRVIRHTKQEVLKDLPAKAVYPVNLEMCKAQTKLYKDAVKLLFDELPKEMTIQNAAVHFLRLQQVTANPALYIPDCENPKFDYISDLAIDNPDKRIVVFSHFRSTVEELVKHCKKLDVSVTSYTGKMTSDERTDSIDAFVKGGIQVFVGTIGSAGTGIDGLQSVCDTAIFIDKDWSPSNNTQAEDRLCRLGQTSAVEVFYLQYPKTVDIYVGRKVRLKEEDIHAILSF